jgi:hypothetical protein
MIVRNSAKCTACGIQIESRGQHDFVVHYCEVEPTPGKKWEDDQLVPSGETTWRFAVDGGRAYLRRCGSGYVDTSIDTDDTPPTNGGRRANNVEVPKPVNALKEAA